MQVILRKLHYVLLICVVFSMPFSISHVKLNSYFIILLATNSIPLFFLSKNETKPTFSGILILFISVYLIHLSGLFKTDNFHEAVFELQKKLSILIFPIILFYSPRLKEKERKAVMLSFAVSCLGTALFCLLVAAYRFFVWKDSSFFFYQGLSGIAGMHAAYLSMYFCFSIAILLYLYFEEASNFNLRNKIVFYSTLTVFVISILLLAARMQLAVLIVGFIAYFLYRFSKTHNMVKSIMVSLVVGVFILGLAFLSPTNRERFKEAFNYNIGNRWGEQQVRYLIWSCALELIKTEPMAGAGTGDVQDELQKCYLDNEYISLTYLKNTRFNAHNQFLETTIGLGIPGLLVLLTSIFVSLQHAWKNKKNLYFIFILLFAVSCLTESLLERQSGIVFYAFFNSFFFCAFSKLC